MDTGHQIFYSQYLKEYHEVKAVFLKNSIANYSELNAELKKFEVNESITANTKLILQADLRQNYFHAIETFFEFFFALLPIGESVPDNTQILKLLVKSNWKANYAKIDKIAKGEFNLNILNDVIEFNGHKITVGHYLFYMGTYNGKFPVEMTKSIDTSINAIKKGITEIAKDFADRNEYNAYKHALRIFPTMESFLAVDPKKQTVIKKFDLKNSVSYFNFNDRKGESSVTTKVYDSDRDFKMTIFCSNLIYNVITYREILYSGKTKRPQKEGLVAIRMFTEDLIGEIVKYNVELSNLKITTKLK